MFVDGAILKQVPFKKELVEAPGTWWFDAAAGRLFIHVPQAGNGPPARPQDQEVEVTTRRRIFAPHVRGMGYIAVEGFVMEHCGNQYPADFWAKDKPQWQQAGAVGTLSGHHWRIAHNVIRRNVVIGHEVGIDFEVSPKSSCLGANNVLIDNHVGIRFREAGGVTVAHNTILDSTVPPLDHARYANRRFDGNLYGFAADGAAWTIKKQPLAFAAWRDALHAVNTDGGCDEASVAVGPIAHELDRTTSAETRPRRANRAGRSRIGGACAGDFRGRKSL